MFLRTTGVICAIWVVIAFAAPAYPAVGHSRDQQRVSALVPTLTPTKNPDRYLNTVANGGFELPGRVWSVKYPARFTGHELLVDPERGKEMIVLKGTSSVEQTVTIPTTAPYLHYSYQLRGGTGPCTDVNFFSVLISAVSEFATKSEQFAFCAAKNSTKWIVRSIDLRSMKGKKVTLHFRTITSNGWAVIDDVGFVSAPSRPVDYY